MTDHSLRQALSELGIPGSTLSHHLDKLKNEELVRVRREGT
jgi:ArsR family transcriptional regulator